MTNSIKEKDEFIDEITINNSYDIENNDIINDLDVSPINPTMRKMTRESIIMPNMSLSNTNYKM